MQTFIHKKFHIGPHKWQAFSEEKLFDPANPAIQTATKVRKRCGCGMMLTTIEPTGHTAPWKAAAVADIL